MESIIEKNMQVRRKKQRLKSHVQLRTLLLGSILPIGLLIIWEVAGRNAYLNPLLLSMPSDILLEFIYLVQHGHLLGHLQISTWRALSGFVLGGGLGLLAGIVVGFSYLSEKLLNPSIQMLRMLPHLAIAPLFILWFGFGETSKLLLIAKGSFFPLYVNTFLGLRSMDRKLFEVAHVLQFNKWHLLTKVIIPSALPNIFLGLRLSLGIAWLGLVVAEMMGSTSGIGFLINDARAMAMISTVFVGIIIFAALGKISDSLILWIERKCLRWQQNFKGG
ncbi:MULTISPECIES: ABC transporter permease [unclassified Lysinibacillus]|uniref:ABC transporter permease n=1 Tax=unclassified Lysinibacillus TaxID=2636778 RepID=UPI00116F78C8|nr:ABC transporter permease [Lysinibacillus sp. CD3-6]QPQ35351.1 ABC transporter permease [Lysinibacillus sp. JNUCC-52]UED78616.1 ABC transporter permease [Lysinibacillus sp. CD3-6]